jgi:glutathione S-transferase
MARVDEVYDTSGEIMSDVAAFVWNPRFHEARAEHRETMKKRLASLDRYFARTRADAEHWVLPGRYTLADIVVAYMLETMMPLHPGLVQEFPALHHMMSAFFQTPRVREYVRGPRRLRTFTVPRAPFAGTPEETHQWTDA